MFGLSIVSDRYLELLERQLDEYKSLCQEERIRADRMHDALLVQAGQAPATETGLGEHHARASQVQEQLRARQDMLTELFADSVGEGIGSEESESRTAES